MKKLVSFLMAALILTALLAMSVSAEQTCQDVTVPKFTKSPTIDGAVSEEEWGEKSLRVVTTGAADPNSNEVGVNAELGLKNFFYYYEIEGSSDGLAYDLWFRWDENNLYIAAVVDDPDPFSQLHTGSEMYRGDGIKFMFDEYGVGGVMAKNVEGWNWRTDAFNPVRYKNPWYYNNKVFSCNIGLNNGVNPIIWRPEYKNDMAETIKAHSLVEDGAAVGITTVDNGDDTCTTTYEVAIPWAAISALIVPEVGNEYGVGIAVSCSDTADRNAFLQWGQAVMTYDGDNVQPNGTRGGSQALVLGDEEITPANEYPVATAPAETTTPEDPFGGVVLLTQAPPVTTEPPLTNENGDVVNKPSVTTVGEDDEFPTAVVIGIVAAVLVVVVVVVIIIVKKKPAAKNAGEKTDSDDSSDSSEN